MIREIDHDLFVLERPLRFSGVEVGARMTIARLSSGGLFLHSPTKLDEETKRSIDSLGEPRVIVAPNAMHHLFIKDYMSAYPSAKSYAAPGLEKKRADLSFHGVIADQPIAEGIEHHILPRLPLLQQEVIFLLQQQKTLLCTDTIFHIQHAHGFSRVMLAIIGGYKRAEPPLEVRLSMKLLARASCKLAFEHILSWDFDRLIMAHGEIIETNAKEILRDSLKWLL